MSQPGGSLATSIIAVATTQQPLLAGKAASVTGATCTCLQLVLTAANRSTMITAAAMEIHAPVSVASVKSEGSFLKKSIDLSLANMRAMVACATWPDERV